MFLLSFTRVPVKIILCCAFVVSISFAFPLSYNSNNCNDSSNYYTSTKIINNSILYSITTYDNKTQLRTIESVLVDNPSFVDYMNLNTFNTNITLHGKVMFEYEMLEPCYYTCLMEIFGDMHNSKKIAKYFHTYYQPGRIYHMLCNSAGCRFGSNYCETFKTRDEL